MPRYDFRCPAGHQFEAYRSMADRASAPCPECDAIAPKIIVATPGVIMRPEGWDLRPSEPGFSKLPAKDREIYKWQK